MWHNSVALVWHSPFFIVMLLVVALAGCEWTGPEAGKN